MFAVLPNHNTFVVVFINTVAQRCHAYEYMYFVGTT